MKTPEIPQHPLHERMAKAMGIDPMAFHKGRIVLKREGSRSKRRAGRKRSR